MNTKKVCRECGQPLPPDALLGLCPQCLMRAALQSDTRPTVRVAEDAFVEGPETETKEFVPGTKLGYIGDYELVEEIARGGMGVVYKARQSSLKRIVAVKMIRSGELAGETEVKRFHAEAEAAAQLQHPNIVAIHEIGEHQGRQYFSMDFVEGKNLAQVAKGKPVAARSAAEWLKAIAGAVQFAHQSGVLHRDLKPQNIMLDAAGQPRVMDFGLAKTLGSDSSVTHTGAVMGSPSYMSPEQALGRNDLVGPASDVYSLGAILFELLTGRPPFRGKSPIDTISQVVNDEPPPPRSLNADAPMDLESICLKCLEKDSARRYPTARELELDLGRFLEGEPVQARPANVLRRTWSWFRRHRWVLSAAISVLILTLAGLAYGLWEQTRFLMWLNAHPGVVKAPAPRSSDMDEFLRIVLIVMLTCGPMLAFLVQKLKARPFWKKISPALNPLAPGVFAAKVTYGLFGIAFALTSTADVIHKFVWESEWPNWIFVLCVLVVAWASVAHLIMTVRQQMRIPVTPGPEYKASPEFHSSLGWIVVGLVILLSGLWTLSVPQTLSESNLRPLIGGFVVAVTVWLALFLLPRGWPALFGASSAGVAASPWALSGTPGWIKVPARIAMTSLLLLTLVVDFIFALLVLGTTNSNPNTPHAKGLFICGLLFGGLLIFVARRKKLPLKPRPEAKPTPPSLSADQLAPIHEAIFAGRTNDAFKLYHAANGEKPDQKVRDMFNLRRMESELKLSHPEKFSAGVLERTARNTNRWAWLWRLTLMLVGLAILFLPRQSFGWLIGLLYGLGIGAFIRAMSSNRMSGWRTAYRQMGPAIKFLSWILVVCFAFAFASVFYSLIVHPDMALGWCACSLVAGWLLVHWSIKKRKAS